MWLCRAEAVMWVEALMLGAQVVEAVLGPLWRLLPQGRF